MKRSVLRWELLGIVFISLLGSVMHFVFELAGEWAPVGAIAAVNESVFEHLKLTFWPAVLYAAVSYNPLKEQVNNFIIAKTVGIYVMPLAILALFYAYTSITGTEILIVDIVIFVVAVALGQLASYRILTAGPLVPSLKWVALACWVALGLAYALLTYYTPHTSLFMDSTTGTYGISP